MEKIYKGEIQRLMPIFQAMAEGRTIQVKYGNGWIDIDGDEDGLNLDSLIGYPDCFRIKPKPKYRPFKDAEECWAEMQKHQPFGWVKMKTSTKTIHYIVELNGNSDHPIEFKRHSDSLKGMFGAYIFADGTPFGVKEEE